MSSLEIETYNLNSTMLPNGSYYSVDNLTRLNISSTSAPSGDYDDDGRVSLLTEPYFIMRILFSSLAIFANLLSLFAIANIKCTYTTHLRLTISLCMSDLLFSMFVIAYTIFSVVFDMNENKSLYRCIQQAFQFIFYFSLIVTLLNIMAMALDHYLAIIRPLHYPIMMTRTKAIAGIMIIWTTTTVLAFSDWIVIAAFLPANATMGEVCSMTHSDGYMPQYVISPLIILTLITIVLIYTKILIEIRKHHQRATNNPDLQKNRKALITTLCIMGSYCVLWMPYFLFDLIITIRRVLRPKEFTMELILRLVTWTNYLNMLVFLNALMDPIIYAIRMAEVQRSYLRLLNKFRLWLGKEPLYRSGDTRTANPAPPTGNNGNHHQHRNMLLRSSAGVNGSGRGAMGSGRNKEYNSLILKQHRKNINGQTEEHVFVYINNGPKAGQMRTTKLCQQQPLIHNSNGANELL